MKVVHLRNGKTMNFPDSMSNDQIQSAVYAANPGYQSQGISTTQPANWSTPAPSLPQLQQAGQFRTGNIVPFLKGSGQGLWDAAKSVGAGVAQGTQNLFSPVYGLARMPTPNVISGAPDPLLAKISEAAPYVGAAASGIGTVGDAASMLPGPARLVGNALLPDMSGSIIGNAARAAVNQGATGAAIGAATNANPYNPGGAHPGMGALQGAAIGAGAGAAGEGLLGLANLPRAIALRNATNILKDPINQANMPSALQNASAAQAGGISPSLAHIFSKPAARFNQAISKGIPDLADKAAAALQTVKQSGKNLIDRLSGGLPQNELPGAAVQSAKQTASANQAQSNANFKPLSEQANKLGINTGNRPALSAAATQLNKDSVQNLPDSDPIKQVVQRFIQDPAAANPTKSFQDLWDTRKGLDLSYRDAVSSDTPLAKHVYGTLAKAARQDMQSSLDKTPLQDAYNSANSYYQNYVEPLSEISKLNDGDYQGLMNLVKRSANEDIPTALQQSGTAPNPKTPNLVQALLLKRGQTEGVPEDGAPGIIKNYDMIKGSAPHLVTPVVKGNAPLFDSQTQYELGNLSGQNAVANQMAQGFDSAPNPNEVNQMAQQAGNTASNPFNWIGHILKAASSPFQSASSKILGDPQLVTALQQGGLKGVQDAIRARSPLGNIPGGQAIGSGLTTLARSPIAPTILGAPAGESDE